MYTSQQNIVLPAGKRQATKNAKGTALSSMLTQGHQTSKISITDQMASTPDHIGAGDAMRGDESSWTQLPTVIKS